jgi:NADH-quinone oxidoreductase subunit M
MNIDHTILTLILLTPLVGAGVLALIPEREGSKTHAIGALIFTLITFGLTLHLPAHFHYGAQGFQYELNLRWIPEPAIRYHVGVDGLSMWLIVLAGVLAPVGVLASWNTIQQRTRLFYTLFLLQQVAMFGIFVALDVFLYYGFWAHRHLRPHRKPPPRCHQILPVRLHSVCGAAGCDPLALQPDRNVRPGDAADAGRAACNL